MIVLLWKNRTYIMEGDFYSVREKLGIPDEDSTPWGIYQGPESLEWTKNFVSIEVHKDSNREMLEQIRNTAPAACNLSECNYLPNAVRILLEFAWKAVTPPQKNTPLYRLTKEELVKLIGEFVESQLGEPPE